MLVCFVCWPGILQLCHASVCAQSCPTLCNPMVSSPLGSSVHAIFQARILEWVALCFSRGSSWPTDQIHTSSVSSISRRILYHWATWEAPALLYLLINAESCLTDSVEFSTVTLICLLWIKIVLFLFFYTPFVSFSLFFSLKSAFPGSENSNVRFLLKPYFLICILLPFVRLISEFDKIQLVDWMEVLWAFFLVFRKMLE